MDKLEFTERLYADPFTEDQDIIAAAADNPELAHLRLEAQDFDRQLGTTMQSTPVPSGLMAKLLTIPNTDASTEEAIASIGQAKTGQTNAGIMTAATPASNVSSINSKSRKTPPLFQYFALAAGLVVAMGVTFSYFGNNGAPSAAEVAFGNEILNHLRLDTDAAAAMASDTQLQMQAVNTVLDQAGLQFVSTNSLGANVVRFARPCVIIPSNQSAHLVIQGSQGAINVIVINNSPVASEFRIANEYQAGLIIPMSEGNLVLVGEGEEDLDQYSELFSDNLQWSI